MHKTGSVLYIDGLGKPHSALIRAINPMHPGRLTLAYVDEKADERDNVVTVFDVAHKEDDSRADVRLVKANGPTQDFGSMVVDGNPNLPHYDVNVWMEHDEEHNALPPDHPTFDHPWKLPEQDQQGNRIPVQRPEFEKEIAEHLSKYESLAEGEPTEADLDEDAKEKVAAEATAGAPDLPPPGTILVGVGTVPVDGPLPPSVPITPEQRAAAEAFDAARANADASPAD